MMLAAPVTAQTSENLEWGVEIGDQTFFSFYYWAAEPFITFNENIYINITGPIDAIPDPLTNWWEIPDTLVDVMWVNGTDMGDFALIFLYLWKFALPTGNWSLMTELVENVTEFYIMETDFPAETHVNIDNWYQWGFIYNSTLPGFEYVSTATYLKCDGSLTTYSLVGYYEGTSTMMGELYVQRDGTPPVINHPADITYEVGDTGNAITWSATDQSPAAYRVLKDSIELERGLWNSSSESIVIDVDGLAAGSYDYEIEFYEASGISASDVVTVTVNADSTTTTTTTTDTSTDTGTGDFISENLMLIIGVGGGAVIVLVIIVIISKKK